MMIARLLMALLLFAPAVAVAQAYPAKPVRIIAAYPAAPAWTSPRGSWRTS